MLPLLRAVAKLCSSNRLFNLNLSIYAFFNNKLLFAGECGNQSIVESYVHFLEPCRLNPSRIHIKRRNQAKMIFKKRV